MKMNIEIVMDNDAFFAEGYENAVHGDEIARQLRELANRVENVLVFTGEDFQVRDINGNRTLTAVVED